MHLGAGQVGPDTVVDASRQLMSSGPSPKSRAALLLVADRGVADAAARTRLPLRSPAG